MDLDVHQENAGHVLLHNRISQGFYGIAVWNWTVPEVSTRLGDNALTGTKSLSGWPTGWARPRIDDLHKNLWERSSTEPNKHYYYQFRLFGLPKMLADLFCVCVSFCSTFEDCILMAQEMVFWGGDLLEVPRTSAAHLPTRTS